jgi:hypothetical protein
MAKKPMRGKPAGEEGPTAGGAEDRPERWSAQRKMELVLRLPAGRTAGCRLPREPGARA